MNKSRLNPLFVCAVSLILAVCPQSPAGPQASAGSDSAKTAAELVRMLPDDVLAFVAYSGCDAAGPAFEKSIAGRMWNDPQLQSFYQTILSQIKNKVTQGSNDAGAAEAVDTVQSFLNVVADRPITVGIAQKKEAAGGPPVYGFLILDAAGSRAELVAAIGKMETLAPEGQIIEQTVASLAMHGPKDDGGVPGYWGWVDESFVFAINDADGLALRHIRQPRQPDAVARYLATVPGEGRAAAAYLDIRKGIEILKLAVGAEASGQADAAIGKALDVLGIANVGAAAVSVGFDGPDVVVHQSLQTPGPHTGLLASFGTIDLNIFDMVDSRAANAIAFNVSTAGFYDAILDAIKVAAPAEVSQMVIQAIAQFEGQINVGIRRQILENLAGPTVAYAVPAGAIPEAPGPGFVACLQVKNGRALEEAMAVLGQFFAGISGGMLQVGSQESNGRTLHSWVVAPLAMAQVMPCWTIADGQLVIGSSPAICNLGASGVSSADSAATSIRSTDGFKQVTKNLPPKVVSLRYTDSKVQVRQLMQGLQGVWPMLTMGAKQQGLDLPMVLPSFSGIIDDMGPSCQYTWFDNNGIYSRYRGSGIEADLGAVAGGGVAAAVVMPALFRARQQATQVASLANLKNMGLAFAAYEVDQGELPGSFDQMKDYFFEEAPPESHRKPKDFDGPSYILVPGHSPNVPRGAQYILVYENPEFCDDKVPVLFLDYHVESMEPQRFIEALKATYELLGKEMPDVKFKND